MAKFLHNLAVGGITVCCAVIVAMLAFISMELAVTVFTVASLVYVITSEYKRRTQWEMAANFKFQTLNKKHDALAEKVARQSGQRAEAASQVVAPEETQIQEKPRKTPAEAKAHASANTRKESVSFKDLVRSSSKPAPSNDVSPAQESFKPPKPMTSKAGKKPKPDLKSQGITERKAPKISVMEDADSLSDLVVEELTGHAIKNKQVNFFLQPILRLPQRQRKFYEIFSRVRAKPGVYIPAGRYVDIANSNDQLQKIDALLLTHCLDMLRFSEKVENPPAFFVNINARTLKNGAFMGKLISFLSNNRQMAGRLIFEMRQSEFHDLDLPALKVMGGLAKLGCAFSLDHVTDLNEDIADLQRFRVRFLKADAAMLVKAAKNEREYKAIMKAKRMLEGNGIGLIAEKVEDEAMMRALLDYDLHYGQGYLFGRPDLQGAYEPNLTTKVA